MKNFEEIMSELRKPIPIDEVLFRVQSINAKGVATIVPYKSARIDMDRLDEATGGRWKREHNEMDGKMYCTVSIFDSETKEWVSKSDAGEETYVAKTKGESSDSFKRACTNFGLGRELYKYPLIQMQLHQGSEYYLSNNRPKAAAKLNLSEWEWRVVCDEKGIPVKLGAIDPSGKVRFSYQKQTEQKQK